MGRVIVLYSDGTLKNKNEYNLTKNDIKFSDYLMIHTDIDNPENFILVESSKYHLFSKAVIDYQLSVVCSDDADLEFDLLDPIHMETDSLTDLINCINNIDRFNVPNNLIIDRWSGDGVYTSIEFLSIILYDNNGNVIYDSIYDGRNKYSHQYMSFKITKHFKQIYSGNISNDLYRNKEFIYINKNKWEISDSSLGYTLIGIPLSMSNTFIFINQDTYIRLSKYKRYRISAMVYYSKQSTIADISEGIVNGDDEVYKTIDDLINTDSEIYIDNVIDDYINSIKDLLDFVCFSKFAISVINLIFCELYPYDTDFDNKHIKWRFDTILIYNMYYNSKHGKRLCINQYSIISVSDILNNL